MSPRAQLEDVLRRPGPAVAMLVIGVLAGLGVGLAFTRDEGTASPPSSRSPTVVVPGSEPKHGGRPPQGTPAATPAPDERAGLESAMRRAQQAVDTGKVAIAVQRDDWAEPVAFRSRMRFKAWSTIKVVSSVALLSMVGTTRDYDDLLEGALVRSENCRARSIIFQIQQRVGTASAVLAAIRRTLSAAGPLARRVVIPLQTKVADAACKGYVDPVELDQEVPQLGPTRWNVAVAAAFMHAVRANAREKSAFGQAAKRVLRLMRRPKGDSTETDDPEPRVNVYGVHTDPRWGLGSEYGDRVAQYKGGWGGAIEGDHADRFVAEQMGVVPVASGGWASVAIAYQPTTEPGSDDPGDAAAPQVYAAILEQLRPAIEALR